MNYKQSGILGDSSLGERLSNYEPGQNLPDVGGSGGMIGGDGGMAPDLGQDGLMGAEVPDSPGPALAGRTPVLGSVRRSNDMPVLRDQLSGMMS